MRVCAYGLCSLGGGGGFPGGIPYSKKERKIEMYVLFDFHIVQNVGSQGINRP